MPDSLAAFRRQVEQAIPVGFESHKDPLNRAKRLALWKQFDRLDEPKRRLFVLKFVEELTNQEIADELGVSLSTVKRSNTELVQTIQRVRREDG